MRFPRAASAVVGACVSLGLPAVDLAAPAGVVFSDDFELGICGIWSSVTTPDPCDAVDNDCDLEVDEDAGCVSGDGCCPGGGFEACNSTNDTDCAPVCGNAVVEAGETCDGNCPSCFANPTPCSFNLGSAGTCDLQCNVPILQCANGDSCCAFGSGGSCGSGSDSECTGAQWQSVLWFRPASWGAACDVIRVFGIAVGGSYVFTTCAAVPSGTGDPSIVSVVDSLGNSYPIGNDDCFYPSALPRLAGSSCQNLAGQTTMACAPQSPGGVVILSAVSWVEVTICAAAGTTAGSAPFIIWWNGPGTPNPG